MDKCPICRTNNADKKNVHLIPWFLIKKCITQRGSGERDMELSFSIEPQKFTKIYTGRSILPESVDEFGELHDVQKENHNPYSRDNIICSECEEKLSRLEAIFASQFTDNKIRKAFQAKLDKINNHTIIVDKKYEESLYELLIQSIFYRCSIGGFNGFKLNVEIQNKIEINLRKAFSIENFKKIKQNDKIVYDYKFPIITTSFFISEGEDTTKNFIVINFSRFPYFIMTGKWMFQLFEANKHLKSTVEWLYGLQSILNASEIYNFVKNKSHIILLEEEAEKSISKNLIEYFTQKRIIGIKQTIRYLHIYTIGTKPENKITQYIYQRYFIHLNEGKSEFNSMVHAFLDLKKIS